MVQAGEITWGTYSSWDLNTGTGAKLEGILLQRLSIAPLQVSNIQHSSLYNLLSPCIVLNMCDRIFSIALTKAQAKRLST